MIYYVNLATGNAANSGLSWGAAKRNVQELSPAAGDEIRVAKTNDPVLVGVATWTDLSNTVVFESSPGLAVGSLISPTADAYGGSFGWWKVASVSGLVVTLAGRGYVGPSLRGNTYRRDMVAAPGQVFDFSGDDGNPITITGGWNTSIGLQDGETYLNGEGTGQDGISSTRTGSPPYRSNLTIRRLNCFNYHNGANLWCRNLTLESSDMSFNTAEGGSFGATDLSTNRTIIRIRNLVGNSSHGAMLSPNGVLDITLDNISSNEGHGLYSHHWYNSGERSYLSIARANNNGNAGVYIESYTNVEVNIYDASYNRGITWDDWGQEIPLGQGITLGGDANDTFHLWKAVGNNLCDITIARDITLNSTVYVYQYGTITIYGTNSTCVIVYSEITRVSPSPSSSLLGTTDPMVTTVGNVFVVSLPATSVFYSVAPSIPGAPVTLTPVAASMFARAVDPNVESDAVPVPYWATRNDKIGLSRLASVWAAMYWPPADPGIVLPQVAWSLFSAKDPTVLPGFLFNYWVTRNEMAGLSRVGGRYAPMWWPTHNPGKPIRKLIARTRTPGYVPN